MVCKGQGVSKFPFPRSRVQSVVNAVKLFQPRRKVMVVLIMGTPRNFRLEMPLLNGMFVDVTDVCDVM